MKKIVVFYGLILALLITLLRYLEYKYLLRDLSIEIYIAIISIIFTGLGVWIALRISRRNDLQRFEDAYFPNEDSEVANEFKLSKREMQVLRLMAQGYSNQEIADRLYVSLSTVKTHAANVYSKLNVKRRTAAIRKLQQLKLLS